MPNERPSTAWLGGLAAALVVGCLAAIYLLHLHVELFFGGGVSEAVCDFGGMFNCSSVNGSEWSEILGVPTVLPAIPAYALIGWLGFRAWQKGRQSAEMALIFGLGVLTTAFSVFLAGISSFVLHAYCLVCIGMYLVNASVLVFAFVGAKTDVVDLAQRCLRALAAPGRSIAEGAGVFVAAAVLAYGGFAVEKGQAIAALTEKALEAPEAVSAAPAISPAPTTPATPTPATPAASDTKKVRIQEAKTKVVIPDGAPSLGPKNAPVQVAAFLDFQCPFCKRLAGTLHQLHEEYPKQVRLAVLMFPMNQECNTLSMPKTLHPEACRAALAARCAGKQGKFFEAHDLLFQDQARLGDDLYASMPARLGLDANQFRSCRGEPSVMDAVLGDSTLGKDAGVTGTPMMFINGRMLSGAQPIEVLRAVVDAELAHNTAMLDLEVPVGTEQKGQVTGAALSVNVAYGSHPFAIDAFEDVIADGKASVQPGAKVATGVTWYQARDACAAAGKRLCTPEEWMTSCMGAAPVDANRNGEWQDDPPTGRFYAYGGLYREGLCADARNPETAGDIIAGDHPGCTTPDGIYDLNGNVKEWVGLDQTQAALTGGSFFSEESARCQYYRSDVAPDLSETANGFRCCQGDVPIPDVSAKWPGGKVGDKLQSFTASKIDGGSFDGKELAGQPAILTFWASWCGPCKIEMPILSKLYDKYKDQGLRVVAVTIDSNAGAAQRFLQSNPMSFLVLSDPSTELQSHFESSAVPTTFWIRRDGTIRLRTVGVPPGGERRLEQLVQELMDNK